MGARQKLNQLHINGSLGLAAVLGWLAGSWLVFTVVAALLLALNVYGQEIRLARRTRRLTDHPGQPAPPGPDEQRKFPERRRVVKKQSDLFPQAIAATLVVTGLGSILGGGWWMLGVGVLAMAVVLGLRHTLIR